MEKLGALVTLAVAIKIVLKRRKATRRSGSSCSKCPPPISLLSSQPRSPPSPSSTTLSPPLSQSHLAKLYTSRAPLISIITPCLNADPWLEECFLSVLRQTLLVQQFPGAVEFSLFDDGSTDGTWALFTKWKPIFEKHNIRVVLSRRSELTDPTLQGLKGCGFGRNVCTRQSSGKYLCFMDADDIMEERRLELQYAMAEELEREGEAAAKELNSEGPLKARTKESGLEEGDLRYTIVGSNFTRIPANSTPRYTEWLNSLDSVGIYQQQFRVGGYSDIFGDPEDLLFFYKHLEQGGRIRKLEPSLLVYRFLESSLTWRVHKRTLFDAKVSHFSRHILESNDVAVAARWRSFSIWSAGRDGKDFFKRLSPENKRRVTCFWDIDPNKVGTNFVYVDPIFNRHRSIPIRSYTEVQAPVCLCVALGRGNGFEAILADAVTRTKMKEGLDYFHMI